uniref:Uncharacterized protein n=1 Tax=Haptolina brevifila TaxID=156173 RepID=A0A7S2JNG4_9EUKA
MMRSFCLAPYKVGSRKVRRLAALQPTLNRLYDLVSQDVEFVSEALRVTSLECAWSAHELEVFRRVSSRPAKPRLLLPNSIFLEELSGSCVLTVGNVQAGEPYQHHLVHTLQRAEHPHVAQGPLLAVCDALATAAKMVHPARPRVAVLTKPSDNVALRTRIDVYGVGRLLEEHGVQPVYVSMRDMARAELDSAGDLLLDGEALSVVYSRFDFSHPLGKQTPSLEAIDAEHTAEWIAVERMEMSSAVVSSTLGCRLAHRRSVQQAKQGSS